MSNKLCSQWFLKNRKISKHCCKSILSFAYRWMTKDGIGLGFNVTINNNSIISVLLVLKSGADHCFLFMLHDGIVPILYLNDGSDHRLFSIKLILYMWQILCNRNGVVMVSVLASSAVDRGFEPRLGQTKDYKIGMCCFSAKHAALRRKSKDWLARNQNNVTCLPADCCFSEQTL